MSGSQPVAVLAVLPAFWAPLCSAAFFSNASLPVSSTLRWQALLHPAQQGTPMYRSNLKPEPCSCLSMLTSCR